MRSKDSTRARLRREIVHLSAPVLSLQTLVPESDVRLSFSGRRADGHSETGLERRDGLLLEVILGEVELRVVHREAAGCALRAAEERLYGNHGDTVVGTVSWMLEVEDGGPVIAV
jgi:hypothetical protein